MTSPNIPAQEETTPAAAPAPRRDAPLIPRIAPNSSAPQRGQNPLRIKRTSTSTGAPSSAGLQVPRI